MRSMRSLQTPTLCADSVRVGCFLSFSSLPRPHRPIAFLPLPIVLDDEASTMSVLASIIKPLVYVSLPVFALKTFADSNPFARYYVRVGLYLSTLGVCSIWGVICSITMGIAGRRFDVFYVIARSFYFIASRVIGIRLIVEGEEHLDTRPAVLVGNHQSMLDILYLGRCVYITQSWSERPDVHSLSHTAVAPRSNLPSDLVESCMRPIEYFPVELQSWPRRSCSGRRSSANL